jgi:tartrate-resistant acid phosphatase type 5
LQDSINRSITVLMKKMVLWVASVLGIALLGGGVWYYTTQYNNSKASSSVSAGTTIVSNTQQLKKYSYVFVGDTGTGTDEQYGVAKAMQQYCGSNYCAGVFLLGDNFYNTGVSSVDDEQWQKKFELPYGQDVIKAPKYPVFGNHDYLGCIQCQLDYFKRNSDWFLPAPYWILQKESEYFFMADTENMNSVQLELLKKQLTEFPKTIVLGHRPIYTNESLHHDENFEGKSEFTTIICEASSMYLNGHSHTMEYFDGSTGCKSKRVTIGTGGASLRDFIDNPPENSSFEKKQFGFATIEIENDTRTLRFWGTNNQELYTTKL